VWLGLGLHGGAYAKGSQDPAVRNGPSPNGQSASTWSWLAMHAAWQPTPCQNMIWGKMVVSGLNAYLFSFTGPSLITMIKEPDILGQVPCILLVSTSDCCQLSPMVMLKHTKKTRMMLEDLIQAHQAKELGKKREP